MPVTTKNTELIPQTELNLLIKYNSELTTTKKNLGAIIPVLHETAIGVETCSGDYGTLVKMLKTFEKLQQDTNTRVKEHNRALTNLEKANKRLAYSRSEEAKKLAEVQEQTRKNNLELRNEAKESLAAENSLEKLRATLSILKAEAATLDINSEEFAKASADINELNGKILAAEASMGDHRRNVGNYASGFNALGFQVQQVARELPSLTVSSQQFFLAISNNLPMLVDEMERARLKNKALREDGKEGIPVWKQLLKSIGSWQTLLVVGITVVTAYGKEIGQFFKELFTGKGDIKDCEDAIKSMHKAMDTKQIGEEIANFNKLSHAYAKLGDDAKAKEKFLSDYRDEINETGVSVHSVLDADNLFIKNTDAFIESIKQRASALAGMKLASEKYGEAIEKEIKNKAKIEKLNSELELVKQAPENRTWYINNVGGDPVHITKNGMIAELQRQIRELDGTNLRKEGDLYLEASASAVKKAKDTLGKGGIETQEAVKSIASLREELSKLEEQKEKVDLTKEDSGEQIAKINSAIKAKQKELEAYEKLYSTDSGSGRLSEKRQAELSLLEEQAEAAANIQEGIYRNEEQSYQDRIAAFDQFKADQEKALTLHYNALREELAARKTAGDIDEGTYNTLLKKINFGAENDLGQMRASHEEAGKDLMDSIAKGMMKEATNAVTQATKKVDDELQAELSTLAQKYAEGTISTEEYEKDKLGLARKYQNNRFEAEIKAFDDLLNVKGLTAEAEEALANAKNDAKLKYEQYTNDMLIKDAEETGKELQDEAERQQKEEEEKAKEIANHKKELMQEVFNLAVALGEAQLKKDLARLDKLSEANEEWKNDEIDRIARLEEQGVISKEQAEARKQAIEDQAAAKEEEIEKQRIEAERKQAIYQKSISATQAIINTALAVTGALGTPFLIPLIIATGAAQLATILAQPLPEYAHGTANHAGGLAIVGDGGRSELVLFPDNTMWRTPPTDTLVNLPAGTQVLPDYDEVIAQFAISRFAERPAGTARVEALLEEQKLQRAMLIEKSCERNVLLRQMLSAKDGERRATNRERALAILHQKKLQK